MSEKNIKLFQETTCASRQQAIQYLQAFNDSIDEAVMGFFESGEEAQPEVKQPATSAVKNPPKVLQQHHDQQKPSGGGFFNLGKKKQEIEPVKQNIQQPQPQKQQPTTVQQPAPQKSNFQQFKPEMKAVDETFNDGGVKEGGSGTAVFRPKDKFDCVIDVYQNGFCINKKFFAFAEPENQRLFNEFMKSHSIPITLFEQFPPEQRPNGKQIDAKLTQHQCDYTEQQQKEEKIYQFDKSEKGRTMGTTQQPIANSVNKSITLPYTDNDNCITVKIKSDSTFTVKCSKTSTIEDILKNVKQNGGLQNVKDLAKCVIKLQSGQEFQLKQTVEQAGIAQKCVLVTPK